MESFVISVQQIEVYFESAVGEYNLYPFHGGVSTLDDIDSSTVLDEYLRRFEGAWKELAEK